MNTKHIALSIALFLPVVGSTVTYVASAKEDVMHSKEAAYITAFFSQEVHNFENNYTIAGLQRSVDTILQQHDAIQASEWNSINIDHDPHKAAQFLHTNRSIFTQHGITLPATEQEMWVTIKETIGWELIEEVLFGSNNQLLSYYEKNGWNQLVEDIRQTFANTKYENIANDIPRTEHFQPYSCMISTQRCNEVKNKLQNHKEQLPITMRSRLENMMTQIQVQKRLGKIITK